MVAQNKQRKCNQTFSEEKTAVDVNECLDEIKSPFFMQARMYSYKSTNKKEPVL